MGHDLPWLVIAALASVVATPRALAGLRARRTAAAVRGAAVVHGTIGADDEDAATTLEAQLGTSPSVTVARSWRAPVLWLDTDDGRVFLEGHVEVVASAHVIATRGGVPACLSDARLAEASRGATWIERASPCSYPDHTVLRSLRPGDEVVATGTLVRTAGGSGDYRASDVRWTLVGPIRIAATRPRGAALAPRLATWGVGAALAALGWLAG